MRKFNVLGMSCAACSARVENAVGEMQGVNSCTVNLLTNSMQVEGEASDDAIIAVVRAVGYDASIGDEMIETGKEKIKVRLIASIVLLTALMYISMGYTMLNLPLPAILTEKPVAVALLQMVLAACVMVINKKFFINGFKGLFKGSPNMDTLVAIGSLASFVYSAVVMFNNGAHMLHDLYFESAAMILTLITVGKLLEARAKGKTGDALSSLIKLAPKTATLLVDGKENLVPVEKVAVGDIFIVRPGDSIPVDGVIIEGMSAINESALTGESIPADKTVGDSISAATLNQSGYLVARATRVGEDTSFSQIIKMVSDASATKAPIAKMADKVSGIFVPVVMGIAVITFIIWILIGEAIGFALSRAISVLVISCPCALGLATPVAIMVGSGVGAKHGVLFKTATALEITGKSEVVALDKTGTITKGEPAVCEVIALDDDLLQTAYSLEVKSEHPLSRAVVNYAKAKGISTADATEFEAISGKGVTAVVEGKIIHGGNEKYISQFCKIDDDIKSKAEKLANEGKTPLFFEKENELLGIIGVADTVKEDSKEAIAELQEMGLEVIMLTGDNEKTARAIADSVGIPRVIAGVLPEGKEREVKAISGKVCMIGDGINDAPALVSAYVGMAIGAGTDVALESADVILVKNSLKDAASAIKLSRATLKNIKENLFWAFFYNVVGIPLAAGVFIPLFGWELSPMFGAAAMSLSSVCVVSNALRLNFIKLKKEQKKVEKIIKIEGMMCPHCEARVKGILDGLAQVSETDVSHTRGDAKITVNAQIEDSEIKNLIENAGYKVIEIK